MGQIPTAVPERAPLTLRHHRTMLRVAVDRPGHTPIAREAHVLESTAQETLIREFVRQVAKKYGRDYWLACAREGKFTHELWQELSAGGYLGMMIPEESGGGAPGIAVGRR